MQASDGRDRAEAIGLALLATVKAFAGLMVQGVLVNQAHIGAKDAAQAIQNAVDAMALVCVDGCYGLLHADMIGLNLYLSERLWLADDRQGAFDALDAALDHARRFEAVCMQNEVHFTAPLLSEVSEKIDGGMEPGFIVRLPEDWPWWHDSDSAKVEAEIKADPRWTEWVKRTRQSR